MPRITNIVFAVSKPYSPQAITYGLVSTTVDTSLHIKGSGRVWSWGQNSNLQIGDNTNVLSRITPVSVLGAVKTFCQISVGVIHVMAIDKNGRAWGWGVSTAGALGYNSTIAQRTPVSVAGATKTFCKIAAGGSHTVAIDKNGRAWAWGLNNVGQLGNNAITSQLTPVSVLGNTKTFCQISANDCNTVAIDKNGRAWSWGLNNFAQLGDNSITSRQTPVSVAGVVKTFCKISTGTYHTIAIDKNGRAWGWGLNSAGSIGNNSSSSVRTPVSVLGVVKTFCEIAAGGSHTVAIDKNGRAWAWGANNVAQAGIGDTFLTLTPVSIAGSIKTFCKIAAGLCHSIAIDKNGRVWAWGSINAGQLGNTDTISKLTPVSVRGEIKTFCQISMGNCHAAAIDKNGRLWSWGNNISGQLGNNDLRIKLTPVSVVGTVKTFCKISIGNNHTVAIDKNGRLWSWGTNDSGQLGTNSTTSQRTPVSVLGNIKTFCEIQVITNFSSALDKNGRVWSWGINFAGQIGDNSTTSKSTPVAILGSTKTFCKISAGLNYSMAIDKNGRAWGWGINSEGQLGDNSVTSRLTPVSVLGATKTFCKIAAGGSHTVAIDKNGRLWSWGLNGSGQLGINSTTSQRTPVSVLGNIKTFCEIAAGDCHTLAIDKYGRLWSWGMNSVGQLGINSTTSQRTPVSVLGTIKTFCKIEVSTSVNAAIDKNGRAWTWGLNNSGPLGINEGERLTPVRVYNL